MWWWEWEHLTSSVQLILQNIGGLEIFDVLVGELDALSFVIANVFSLLIKQKALVIELVEHFIFFVFLFRYCAQLCLV